MIHILRLIERDKLYQITVLMFWSTVCSDIAATLTFAPICDQGNFVVLLTGSWASLKTGHQFPNRISNMFFRLQWQFSPTTWTTRTTTMTTMMTAWTGTQTWHDSTQMTISCNSWAEVMGSSHAADPMQGRKTTARVIFCQKNNFLFNLSSKCPRLEQLWMAFKLKKTKVGLRFNWDLLKPTWFQKILGLPSNFKH